MELHALSAFTCRSCAGLLTGAIHNTKANIRISPDVEIDDANIIDINAEVEADCLFSLPVHNCFNLCLAGFF